MKTWQELVGEEGDPPSRFAQDWLQHVPGKPPDLGKPRQGSPRVMFPSLSRPRGQGVLDWEQESRMTCVPHSSGGLSSPVAAFPGHRASQGVRVSVGTVRCAHRSAFERRVREGVCFAECALPAPFRLSTLGL